MRDVPDFCPYNENKDLIKKRIPLTALFSRSNSTESACCKLATVQNQKSEPRDAPASRGDCSIFPPASIDLARI
jgi:hypothetical protein